MGRSRRTVAKTGAGENGIRAILLRNRKHELDRWRIPGGEPDEFESALEAGEAVVVDSATLWIAFERAGIPNADFARHELGGRLDVRFWLVSAAGEVSEWSRLPNAEVDADKKALRTVAPRGREA
jgi:hypothetical protein